MGLELRGVSPRQEVIGAAADREVLGLAGLEAVLGVAQLELVLRVALRLEKDVGLALHESLFGDFNLEELLNVFSLHDGVREKVLAGRGGAGRVGVAPEDGVRGAVG